MIGRTLGHYEIVDHLGAGGMGEVYRARDTHLHRDVAIKVLPEGLDSDPDRIARLVREARLLAALDHPNIATIYGLEESGGTRFIAMEAVEGETLAEHLKRGPLPVELALRIATHIAQALEAAHDKGIIHRDLKPANVMLTPDVKVKVLDFGLAKALEAEAPIEDLSHSPTIAAATRAGVILGTAAYMSPEQARGRPVDRRTDIWSFGCVLYEMLTGRKPFAGADVSDMIAAILRDEPDWSLLPAATPAMVQSLVRRCLRRDPDRRVHDIADARIELEEALTGGWGAQLSAAAPAPGPLAASRTLRLAVPVAVVLLALAAWWVVPRMFGGNAIEGVPRMPVEQVTFLPGPELFPALSPDGEWVVYANNSTGNLDIYVQGVGDKNPRNLTEDYDGTDTSPAFSPNGRRIAFRSNRDGGGIFVMGRSGESQRRLTDFGYNPYWSSDGSEVLVSLEGNIDWTDRGDSAIWAINVATGKSRVLVPEEDDGVMSQASPNGHRIAYWRNRTEGPPIGDRDVWTRRVDGSDPVPVATELGVDWNPVWSPDGRYLYFCSDRGGSMGLWRVRIEETTGAVLGEPQLVPLPAPAVIHPSFSGDGTRLAYVDYRDTSNISSAAFDPEGLQIVGAHRPVTEGFNHFIELDVSPDGAWLATTDWWRNELVIVRADGSGLSRVTQGPELDRVPDWSPDGTRLAFYSNRDHDSSGLEIFTINRDGSGLQQVTHHGGSAWRPRWSLPDGKRLLYWDISTDRRGTYMVNPDLPWGEQTPFAFPPPGDGLYFRGDEFSPDGKLIIGQIREPSPDAPGDLSVETAIYSFETETYRSVGERFGWPVRGGWLGEDRVLVRVWPDGTAVLDLESLEVELVLPGIVVLAVSPDKRTVYFQQWETQADIWVATFE